MTFTKGYTPWNKGGTSWNKGMRGWMSSSSFKKGHTQSNTGRTHFKKGQSPWNKGKKCPTLMGSKHPNWKGGVSRAYKTGYYSVQYVEWRQKVFKRDDYTCQKCSFVGKPKGRKSGYITAHHIKSWAKYPKLRYQVSNGITLCEDCHSSTDKYRARFKIKAISSQAKGTPLEGSETT